MPVRRLSAAQLYDSLAQATGYRPPTIENRPQAVPLPNDTRSEFIRLFSTTESPLDAQTSILQALALMNGEIVAGATDVASGDFLAAVVESPFFDEQQRLETLFIATLTRWPTAIELERISGYVRTQQDQGVDATSAYGDIMWALLNSAEFGTNH